MCGVTLVLSAHAAGRGVRAGRTGRAKGCSQSGLREELVTWGEVVFFLYERRCSDFEEMKGSGFEFYIVRSNRNLCKFHPG